MINSLRLVIVGIVLGTANVIPGVSGGTMAVALNVYDRIIALISFNIKKIFSEWKFWVPLVIGMAIGILAFSRLIVFLLGRFPVPTAYFFAGLVAGSIPLVIRKIRLHAKDSDLLRKIALALCVIAGIAAVLALGGRHSGEAASLAREISPVLMFLAGAIAAVAMIIPGISGSFLLVVLGIYGTVMSAISTMDFALLVPFALGVVAGLILGAALVRLLMRRVPAYTYSVILGLVAGSIVTIARKPDSLPVAAASVLALALGFAASYFSSKGE